MDKSRTNEYGMSFEPNEKEEETKDNTKSEETKKNKWEKFISYIGTTVCPQKNNENYSKNSIKKLSIFLFVDKL